jgi:hypothetical protein
LNWIYPMSFHSEDLLNEWWTIPSTLTFAPAPIFAGNHHIRDIFFYLTKESYENNKDNLTYFLLASGNVNKPIKIHVLPDSGFTVPDFYQLVGGPSNWEDRYYSLEFDLEP